MHIGQVPQVGDQIAVSDEPEIQPVKVARHSDIQALTIHDDRHRELVFQLGSIEVQRLSGPGNIGDRQVERLNTQITEPKLRCQPEGRGCHQRRGVLREVHQLRSRHQLERALGALHRRAATGDPLQRIVTVGRQLREDVRHPIGPRVLFLAGPQRYRHHRPQRAVGQRVVGKQVLTQTARADRHHNVVDRAAGGLLEALDVLQGYRAHRESAVRSDRFIPGRPRSRTRRERGPREPLRADLSDPLDRCADRRRRAAQTVDPGGIRQMAHRAGLKSHRLERVSGEVSQRSDHQLGI